MARKQYGFNPNAAEWLKSHLGDRFKTCQAIAILGCSKSTFMKDRAASIIVPNRNVNDKPFYYGKQLLAYLVIKQ